MKGLNLYLVGSLENQFDVHLGLASSMTEQKSCDYTGKIKREGGNHAVTKAMYFTQKKTQICECAHYRDIDCIVYASDCTLVGLSDITNWWYYFTYFFYVPNFLPKQ